MTSDYTHQRARIMSLSDLKSIPTSTETHDECMARLQAMKNADAMGESYFCGVDDGDNSRCMTAWTHCCQYHVHVVCL